jgi:hypothetical protein
MDVVRAYPAPESPSEAATLAPGQSAPPPGVAA